MTVCLSAMVQMGVRVAATLGLSLIALPGVMSRVALTGTQGARLDDASQVLKGVGSLPGLEVASIR